MGARESNRERKHLPVRGPSAIRDAITAAREFAADASLPQPDTTRLAIVVEELVANLYDHGGLSDDDAVEIELSARPDAISLLLTAPGPPFHPRQSQPDDEVPERGGGAGLKLVQAWSLSIDHEHFEGRNRWMVMLPFGSQS